MNTNETYTVIETHVPPKIEVMQDTAPNDGLVLSSKLLEVTRAGSAEGDHIDRLGLFAEALRTPSESHGSGPAVYPNASVDEVIDRIETYADRVAQRGPGAYALIVCGVTAPTKMLDMLQGIPHTRITRERPETPDGTGFYL